MLVTACCPRSWLFLVGNFFAILRHFKQQFNLFFPLCTIHVFLLFRGHLSINEIPFAYPNRKKIIDHLRKDTTIRNSTIHLLPVTGSKFRRAFLFLSFSFSPSQTSSLFGPHVTPYFRLIINCCCWNNFAYRFHSIFYRDPSSAVEWKWNEPPHPNGKALDQSESKLFFSRYFSP